MHRTLELPPLATPLPSLAGTPRLDGAVTDDVPFTLAGRRASLHGGEARGIDGIRLHGRDLLRDLRIENAAARPRALAIEISPIGIERRLAAGGTELHEKILVSHELPAAIVEWSAPTGGEFTLVWRLAEADRCTARWARSPTSHDGGGALWLTEPGTPSPRAVIALSEAAALAVDGAAVSGEVRVPVRLEPGGSVRLMVAAAADGDEPDLAAVLEALDTAALTYSRVGTMGALGHRRLAVEPPDPRIGEALAWATYRLESYRVELPGVGRVPVVGYGVGTPRGASAQDASYPGAPGPDELIVLTHDAVWTALAALSTGDAGTAGELLDLLGRHQHASGQVPGGFSAAGEACFDGADATPLFLLLTARYLAWTGDIARVRQSWPRVQAALEFAVSQDRDGDGLPERPSGAGPGLSPADPLDGRITFHEAGVWAASLTELAVAAEAIGETTDSERVRGLAERVRMLIGAAFRDSKTGRYASRLERPDATASGADRTRWRRDIRQTALHALPLLLGAIDPEAMRPWLDDAASAASTTPRGVRLRPVATHAQPDDPDRPTFGDDSVYPLHTGWVSWAEYVAGRGEAGFGHWVQVVEEAYRGARGAWAEAVDGSEPALPDRAVSTAMAAAPFVYGVLGADPDATRHRLRLRPQLPAAWDRLDVQRLRMGDAEITLCYRRAAGRHTFELEQESGGVPVTVIFEPVVPGRVLAAMIDGQPAELDARPFGTGTLVPVQIVLDHPRTLEIHVEDDAEC